MKKFQPKANVYSFKKVVSQHELTHVFIAVDLIF